MAQAINCNYSRTAIRSLCQREFDQCGSVKYLSRASIVKVVEEYNRRFSVVPGMQLSLSVAHKRIRPVLAMFTRRWHPESQKDLFLNVFSLTSWLHLPLEEKSKHTLQKCSACNTQHVSLTRAFPVKKGKIRSQKQPIVAFHEHDLSSPSQFGKKALKELNAICTENFEQSFQDVITETPRSKLVIKPSSQERQTELRRTVRSAKKAIQQAMDENSMTTVMSNRISWRKFDKIRKSKTLEDHPQTPTRKRKTPFTNENTPPSPKRKHASPTNISPVVEEALLEEALAWDEDENVNWSDLARKHGISKSNGGQSVKELLRDHDIPAASKWDVHFAASVELCLEGYLFRCNVTRQCKRKHSLNRSNQVKSL